MDTQKSCMSKSSLMCICINFFKMLKNKVLLDVYTPLPMTCSITELRRHSQKQYNYMGFYQLTNLKKNFIPFYTD